ncbi:hypothetical protein AB0O68_30490 [Streptomyces sp. NPDC087512]|uniref:hypothetical protein n=1 Tax=Streptomyces sp. NPDC087512 TaxID=3155059 RepID=UPI003438158E
MTETAVESEQAEQVVQAPSRRCRTSSSPSAHASHRRVQQRTSKAQAPSLNSPSLVPVIGLAFSGSSTTVLSGSSTSYRNPRV